jgi:plastocyanin
LILAACGSSGSSTSDASTSDASTSDASTADASTADAVPATVRTVTCPPGDLPTVMTSDDLFAYNPMVTAISAHGVVKFVMSPTHNVIPDLTLPHDSGLHVGFGQTACLEFDQAGTFNFQCMAHGFRGQIIVQ